MKNFHRISILLFLVIGMVLLNCCTTDDYETDINPDEVADIKGGKSLRLPNPDGLIADVVYNALNATPPGAIPLEKNISHRKRNEFVEIIGNNGGYVPESPFDVTDWASVNAMIDARMPRVELELLDGISGDSERYIKFLLNTLRYAVYTESYANRVLTYIMFDRDKNETVDSSKMAVVLDSRYFLYYVRGFCFDRLDKLSIGIGGSNWSAHAKSNLGWIASPPVGKNPKIADLENWYSGLLAANKLNMSNSTATEAAIRLSNVGSSRVRSNFGSLAHEITHFVGSSHNPDIVKPVANSARANEAGFFEYLGYVGNHATFNEVSMDVHFTTNAIQFISGNWFRNFQDVILPAEFSKEDVSVDEIYARCPGLEYYK